MLERGEEEERRLMYVASTRAKKILVLTHSRNRGTFRNGVHKNFPAYPSKFLYEMGLIDDTSDS